MLKETALRKKLSELGISSTGPRALLEKRHKEWVTLWNANCDAAKPKRRQQLLHDLEVWERTQSGRAVMGGRIGSSAVMVKDKDFDGRAWASTHDESFRELIENARRSRVKAGAKEADPEQPSEETSRTREIQEVPSSSPPPDAEDDAMDTGEAIQPQERIPGDDGRLAQVPNASAAIPLDDMADLKRRPRDDNDWENIDTAPIC
jgi:E3 ubiquitin-protein ligase RAD18